MLNLILFLVRLLTKKKDSPKVVIPSADPNVILVLEAQNWVGTVEVGGDNSGPDVERFQRAVNAHPNKEAWCADFVIFCIQQVEQKMGIKSKIYRTEHALDLIYGSPPDMLLKTPIPGAVIVWQHGDTTLGHAGIVEAVAKDGNLTTIEGNTSSGPGIQREGDGVYRRLRSPIGTAAMHVIGFLKPF